MPDCLNRIPAGAELVFELSLPWQTPSNNQIKGMHYHQYRKLREQWREGVWAALNGKLPKKPLHSAFIEIDRYCQGKGLDWDNAYGGLKILLDCIVAPSKRNPDGLGLILDDSPVYLPEPPFVRQLPAPRGQGYTDCRIYRLS